ncbi:ABC transporter substrate-binding protein [Arenibaculum sp.]|uniref:ABC transporter substrate-binding protein n=1 Tax=Arenibaculum sp. TaxID=2865862 RepID=UPI002E16007D|nr:ABC transporter substrate-binding protein [Arenibaculum sp.]
MNPIVRLAAAFGLLLAFTCPAAAETRTLRIASPWEITGLDPARSGYIFARMQVAETLVTADGAGRPLPGLARSWSVSPDGSSWTFELRPGAVFHDGTPVTAQAVVHALERARSRPGPLAGVPIARMRAEAGAVTIRTERPFVSLPAFLAHYETIVLAPSAYDDAGAVVAMVATGPFRVETLQPPLSLTTVRFDGWWGEPPAIERASYLAVPRGETRAAMAESGQAELVFVLAPETVDRLRRSPRVVVHSQPIPRSRVLKLNAGHPFLADPRVREAISLAIDREGIAAAILRSPASTATQLYPPSLPDWHVPGLPPLAHDPGRAGRLLAEAGWAPGPGGILVKDGAPFRLTLRTASERPEQPPMAAAIQAQLREVGIDVTVAIANSGDIPAGHRDGTLELALFARTLMLVPDPLATLLQDYGPSGGDWGAMGWSDPALVEALHRLGGETDPQARARLRAEVATILHGAHAVLPVAWFDYHVAASRRLAGVSVDPLELSYRLGGMRWAD